VAEILKTLRKYNIYNFTLTIDKNKILHLFFLIIIAIILEYRYISFVHVEYERFNFTLNFNFLRLFVGKTLFIFSFLLFFIKQTKFIYFSTLSLNLFLLLPNIIIYQYTNAPISIVLLILFLLFLLSSNIFDLTKINAIKNIQERKIIFIKDKLKLPILLSLSLLFLLPFIISYGFNIDFRVFTFSEIIYDIREKASLLSNIFTNYLYSPLSNFILPILIIFGIIKKKWQYVIFGIIAMTYLYAIIPQKGTFMGIGIILIFYFFNDFNKKISFFLTTITVLLIATIFFTNFLHIDMPESIFIRRLFFIPAVLNNAYFEIFNSNHIHLSHSILRYFIDYPYSVEPPFYVSKIFWGMPSDANNGIISDGFMNFGIIGSIIEIIIATIILKFIDLLNISYRFLGVMYMIIRLFISGALLTSLLTHGLLLLFLILILFLKGTNNETIEI